MKRITIPERFGYPTVDIYVNNTTYTLKTGEEITIDDHVAEIIENAIALAPKQGRNISKLAQFVEGCIEEISAVELDGCTVINAYAFCMCDNLHTVNIPSSVVNIKDRAFSSCNKLKTVNFAKDSKLETIGAGAFIYDYELSYANIPNGIKTIGDTAFAYCYGLSTITIPESVETIGSGGFSTCKGLSRVIMRATTPPSIQANTFLEVPADCKFEVPSVAVDAYKAAPNWSALANRIIGK